jgi:predicted dehydrogenase
MARDLKVSIYMNLPVKLMIGADTGTGTVKVTKPFQATGRHGPRVAILGAGLMGRWHAHAARAVGGRIIGVADPNLDAARRVAGPRASVYPGLEAMLDSDRPDVLHICSPSATHLPALTQALDRGVPVLVEKPLAASAAETRDLYEVSKRAGVLLCPVHQYAFQDCLAPVCATPSRCGTVQRIELVFHSAGATDVDPSEWPQTAADILPHPFAILYRLIPDHAQAVADWNITALEPGGWRLSAQIGSVHAVITISLTARPTEASLTVWGTEGAWEVDLFHGFARFRDGVATRRSKALRPLADGLGLLRHATGNLVGRAVRREAAYPGLRTLIAQAYAALDGQADPPILPEEAIAVAEMRDNFLAATAKGNRQ